MLKAYAVIPAEFATRGIPFQGECTPPELSRLADGLHSDAGVIRFVVSGSMDGRRRPTLTMQVRGTVELICQRCLSGVTFPLVVDSSIVLVPSEEDLPDPADEEDNVDCIVDSGIMDLTALVEDEILLALPIAPRHGPGLCAPAASAGGDGESAGRPFATLKALRKGSETQSDE